ncbi:transmembrane protein 272-like [Photinus pyralis]|uniref:MARVEL domain-containing protein n=1 Tax=Photinus pyralis TaxID=7054 RepID=A0A1Y1LKY9_PHOPY|nr:transmembrane protein 272-like [Photinus pyralis]
MDVERGRGKNDLSFGSFTDRIKEKANHPTVSGALIVFLVLDVVMLVFGIINKDKCPIDNRIPIYLIVAGAVGIIAMILPFINRKLDLAILSIIITILYIFSFVWMIVGSVWVYRIYEPNYIEIFNNYCNKTAYLLAFWTLTIRWIFIGLSIIAALITCCCSLCK